MGAAGRLVRLPGRTMLSGGLHPWRAKAFSWPVTHPVCTPDGVPRWQGVGSRAESPASATGAGWNYLGRSRRRRTWREAASLATATERVTSRDGRGEYLAVSLQAARGRLGDSAAALDPHVHAGRRPIIRSPISPFERRPALDRMLSTENMRLEVIFYQSPSGMDGNRCNRRSSW